MGQDMDCLVMKRELTMNRDMWRDLICGKGLTLAAPGKNEHFRYKQ